MSSRWVGGQCLCGAVAFELDCAAVLLFNNCYCKACQRNSGADFVSQLQLPRSGFRWLRGESTIRSFESSPGVHRAFCAVCGSRLPMTTLEGDVVPVPVGLLDVDPGLRPEVNIFLESRAEWAPVEDGIRGVSGRGTPEFWAEFMASEGRV